MSIINTSCAGCVFANVEDGKQTGCSLHILDLLGSKGIHHIEFDEETKHYMLYQTICYYWRPPQWKEAQASDDLNTLRDKIRNEIRLEADVLIYVGPDQTLEDVDKTYQAIAKMSLLPKKIFFVNNQAVKPGQFMHYANTTVTLPWRMDWAITVEKNPLDLLHLTAKKCESTFLVVFQAGYTPGNHFLSDIDEALYNALERFVVLTPDSGLNGLTYMRIVHQQFNSLDTAKVIKVCEEQNLPHLVRPVHNVVRFPLNPELAL